MAQELAALQKMGLKPLQERFRELFEAEPKSRNLPYLRKKLAYRLQERLEGGLSAEARAQLVALGPADLPVGPGKRRKVMVAKSLKPKAPAAKIRDPRLPEAGTVLVRERGGFAHEVEVLEEGFRYRGRTYRSLSAIAREITGTAWNGFLFFGLLREKIDGQG
jgi:hypothetical protein